MSDPSLFVGKSKCISLGQSQVMIDRDITDPSVLNTVIAFSHKDTDKDGESLW